VNDVQTMADSWLRLLEVACPSALHAGVVWLLGLDSAKTWLACLLAL